MIWTNAAEAERYAPKEVMKLEYFALFLFAIAENACAKTPVHWKTDCVGRLQLNLPARIDVAATTLDDIKRSLRPPSSSFTDGQIAYWTNYEFLGSIEVLHGLSPQEQEQYLQEREKVRDSFREDAKKATREMNAYEPFSNLSVGDKEGAGYQVGDAQLFYVRMRPYVFSWSGGYRGISDEEANRNYKAVLSGMEVRHLFKLPSYPGVCLPYSFIHDDGNTEHLIAMTYRLNEHPDITINLVSRTARPTPAKNDRPETVTNEYNIGDYWAQRMTSVHQFVTLWHRPRSMRSIRLAGQDGLASFVSVIREKGSDPDVIYRTVARGNPETPEAVPDVELVVEQERANAIKRDIKPLTQDEVLNLAKQIAASVAVRAFK